MARYLISRLLQVAVVVVLVATITFFLIHLAPVRKPWKGMARDARSTPALVRAAARHCPYYTTCLPQSLTLWWLLRRQGIESDLRFGARKEAGQMEAHAWVELGGIPLNDTLDVDQRFKPFERAVMPTREIS